MYRSEHIVRVFDWNWSDHITPLKYKTKDKAKSLLTLFVTFYSFQLTLQRAYNNILHLATDNFTAKLYEKNCKSKWKFYLDYLLLWFKGVVYHPKTPCNSKLKINEAKLLLASLVFFKISILAYRSEIFVASKILSSYTFDIKLITAKFIKTIFCVKMPKYFNRSNIRYFNKIKIFMYSEEYLNRYISRIHREIVRNFQATNSVELILAN